MRIPSFAACLLALCIFWLPRPSPAQEETRSLGFGLSLGFGEGITARSVQDRTAVGDIRWLSIQPNIHLKLAQLGDGKHWYHGTLDGLIWGTILVNFEPETGHAGGALAGLRYTMRRGSRLQPYFEGGLGVGSLDFGLRDQADGICFFIQTSLGLRWAVSSRFALLAAATWQHASNAKINPPNPGLDTLGLQLGIEFQ